MTNECNVCEEVRFIYGTTDSVAPWLCKCLKHDFAPEQASTKQKNIYGCCGPFRSMTLKRTQRRIEYCDCR